MSKLPESHDQYLDDQLAEFTDQLLSDEGGSDLQGSTNDDSLAALKQTAIRMKAAARTAQKGSAVSAHIRARLLKEWKQQTTQSKGISWKLFFQPAPRFALAGGLVVLLLLSIFTVYTPDSSPLTGAAMELKAWMPLFVLLGLILVIILIWLDRRK